MELIQKLYHFIVNKLFFAITQKLQVSLKLDWRLCGLIHKTGLALYFVDLGSQFRFLSNCPFLFFCYKIVQVKVIILGYCCHFFALCIQCIYFVNHTCTIHKEQQYYKSRKLFYLFMKASSFPNIVTWKKMFLSITIVNLFLRLVNFSSLGKNISSFQSQVHCIQKFV